MAAATPARRTAILHALAISLLLWLILSVWHATFLVPGLEAGANRFHLELPSAFLSAIFWSRWVMGYGYAGQILPGWALLLPVILIVGYAAWSYRLRAKLGPRLRMTAAFYALVAADLALGLMGSLFLWLAIGFWREASDAHRYGEGVLRTLAWTTLLWPVAIAAAAALLCAYQHAARSR